MGDPDCWSSTVGSRDVGRIRVYERQPGGMLYITVWRHGEGKVRRSLGHRDRKKALADARGLLQVRPAPTPTSAPPLLTLGELFRRYAADGRHLPDGSLKSESYLRHIVSSGRNLAQHFGEGFAVDDFTPDQISQYVVLRRAGVITGNAVRTSAIERELTMLKGALTWARGTRVGGKPLLTSNPLQFYRIPSERDPRRPVVTEAATHALLDVSEHVSVALHTLIVLAAGTGRRIGSILHLRWDDIDFDAGTVRWRAEQDKLRTTWLIPASQEVLTELRRYRSVVPGVGGALLFPHPKQARRPGQPVTTDLASYWLKEAYRRSGAPKLDGSLWHAFRRRWATDRKSLPVKDVAAAGGWKDVSTLIECYQQPDDATLRAVVDFKRADLPSVASTMSRRS